MEAALAEGDGMEITQVESEIRDDEDEGNADIDLDFTKKKKKKKKPFNMDELEATLSDIREDGVTEQEDELILDDNLDLELDFSKTKKKKKKKKDLDELMAEADEKQEDKENGTDCFILYCIQHLQLELIYVISQFLILIWSDFVMNLLTWIIFSSNIINYKIYTSSQICKLI